MRPNLIARLKEEWNNLDPVDPLRGLIADAIDALAEQPASKPWVGLDNTDLAVCDTDGVHLARYWERVLREKNA